MRTRKVILLSLVSAGAAFLFSGCPSQPASPCVIGHAGGSGSFFGSGTGHPYLVQYYLDTDAGAPSAACATAAYAYWPTGDFVGGLFVESFGAVTDSLKLVGMVPEEFGWTNPFTLDYVQGSPNSTPPITNSPIVLGNFITDTQYANGTCIISQQDGGQAVQQFTPIGAPGPQTVSYSINDAVVYTNPAAGEGTQIYYPLTITRDDGSGNVCVRHYIGVGLWPTALCNVDNDCNPNPQPSEGRPLGSGVLPGIPVTCNLTMANTDPIVAVNNFPQVPNVPCTIDGNGDDSCSTGTPPYTTCSNIVYTPTAVACTVDVNGNDSCGTSGVCIKNSAGNSFCNNANGICAQPILDGVGCGQFPAANGLIFINQGGGCLGPAIDNNNTGGTGVCFFQNPSPTKFPYTN